MAKKLSQEQYQKQAEKLEAALQHVQANLEDRSTIAQLRLERNEIALKLEAQAVFIDTQLALLQEELALECQCEPCSTLGET
jgi:hypothetical protein